MYECCIIYFLLFYNVEKENVKIMVKQAKKLAVLSMAGLLAVSNAVPAFATTLGTGITQNVTQGGVFKAGGIEWNLKHDVAKYLKYAGGTRDASGKNFMAAFTAEATDPGNIYGDSYVIMARVDIGSDISASGVDSKTMADIMGQTLIATMQKQYEDSVKKAGQVPIFGGANSTFENKYAPGEHWFYVGSTMSANATTEKVRFTMVGTVKGSSVYMLMCICDGNAEFGKNVDLDMLSDVKITSDRIVSSPLNGVIANDEASVTIGNASLDSALNGAISGDINSGNTATTPAITATGNTQTSAKGHTYKVPVGAVKKDSGAYFYWNVADQNFWKISDSTGNNSLDIAFTFIDSAAYNNNTWDNYNTSADVHKYYKDLLDKVMTKRVNEVETLVDGRGRSWTVYYSTQASSYAFAAAVADIDGITSVVECTMYGGKSKADIKAQFTDTLTGVK